MSKNQVCKRINRTYRWWDLNHCGKEDPHDTLGWETNQQTEGIKVGERPPSHLFPKEASNTECATSVTSPTEQSHEHCEKQDDITCGKDDDVEFIAVGVKRCALQADGVPASAELRMDEPRRSTLLGNIFSPVRYLMQYRVGMSYSMGRKETWTCLGWRPQHWSSIHYLRSPLQTYSCPKWRCWIVSMSTQLGKGCSRLESKERRLHTNNNQE